MVAMMNPAKTFTIENPFTPSQAAFNQNIDVIHIQSRLTGGFLNVFCLGLLLSLDQFKFCRSVYVKIEFRPRNSDKEARLNGISGS
jgi:hypothetical protein